MKTFVAVTALALAGCVASTKTESVGASPTATDSVVAGGATVRGQITSGGHPLPHAIVVVDYQGAALGARADRDGRFEVTGAPTGHHDVFTFADGYIYDHGGFPDLKPGENDHSRTLNYVGKNAQEPTVEHLFWSAINVKPGSTISITGTWTARDKAGISDELFVFVPAFRHPALFGAGVLHRGRNPNGRYTAKLRVPADARPGKYTAYVFGAQQSCYVNYDWPAQTIEVSRVTRE